MASIGGRTVLRLTGNLEPGTGERLQDITRAGVDGVAYRKVGKGAGRTQITTLVDLGSSSAVNSEIEAYKALQGTLVTIVTENGGSYTNVAVLNVTSLPVQKTISAVGGVNGGTHLLRCQWVVQMTESS